MCVCVRARAGEADGLAGGAGRHAGPDPLIDALPSPSPLPAPPELVRRADSAPVERQTVNLLTGGEASHASHARQLSVNVSQRLSSRFQEAESVCLP